MLLLDYSEFVQRCDYSIKIGVIEQVLIVVVTIDQILLSGCLAQNCISFSSFGPSLAIPLSFCLLLTSNSIV